jgi:hypothetical protein
MNKIEISGKVSRAFARIGFQLKKHSPGLLVAAGIVGVAASAVMACKATTKISEILEKSKEDIDTIHDCMANESMAEEYSQEDGRKDLVIVYVQTGVKLAKLYAPAALLGILSIMGILASNGILHKRYLAATAAYAAVSKGFREYRSQVVERFGEETDHDLRYRFAYENSYESSIIVTYLDNRPCSVLEMIAALSIRCEHIMENQDLGNRTGQWFWDMLTNLGLISMDDTKFDRKHVGDAISRFLNREYKPNGEGGLFTVNHCGKDLRSIEIWYQACLYLDGRI